MTAKIGNITESLCCGTWVLVVGHRFWFKLMGHQIKLTRVCFPLTNYPQYSTKTRLA